jgi:glucokinase
VADIGGTNARFAVADLVGPGEIRVTQRRDLATRDHPSLEASLETYLLGLKRPAPVQAALGVACPVNGDRVSLTNRAWSFSQTAFRLRFGFERLEVVNDFAALGHALPALAAAHWRALAGPPWPSSLPPVVSLIGPGTGLGVAAVANHADGALVLASEGGHANFAPHDALEVEILRNLTRRFGRVSFERILSGPGLSNLHAALAEIRGVQAGPLGAPAVVAAALAGADALARETAERFCLILGGAMGDIALIHGAGAVALGGGMAPRLLSFLDAPAVRERFEAKGRARDYMSRIPIALITHPDPALLGAARLILS